MKTPKHTLSAIFAVVASIVMLPAMAERTISSDYTLSADEDWTGDGKVRLVQGAKIDLNGHSLKVAGFAEYLPLDYVETDGNQWVNTLFRPTCTNAVEIKASIPDPSAEQYLYCSRRTSSNRQYSLVATGGKARFDYQTKNATPYTFENGDTSPHVFFSSPSEDAGQESVGEKSKSWTLNAFVDGVSVGSVAGQYFTPDNQAYFCLFGAYSASSGNASAKLNENTAVTACTACRFYYFKVWDTKDKTNLLCDIIPVYGINERKVGLYDRVSGRFLPAIGNDFVGNYYPELDYIDTNGHQWINTLYRPTCTNAVEIKASVADPSETQFLYCSRRAASNRQYSLVVTGGKARFDYQTKNATPYTFENGDTSPHVFFSSPSEDAGQESVGEKSKSWTLNAFVDGVSVGSVAGQYFTPDNQAYFCLFGSYAATTLQDTTEVSSLASCRFYYFKIWDTKDRGTLKCDIVPVYSVTDDAFGLYDRIAGRFLPNKGSSPFPNPLANSIVNGAVDVAELEVSAQEDQGITITSIGDGIALAKSGAGALTFANALSLSTAFRPVAGTISGVTLLDGATLDVFGLSGAFSLDDNVISFADSAKIYIDVGSRAVTKNTALVSWTSAPANIDGLKFRLVAGGEEHSMLVKSDGLYFSPVGLTLTFY